MKYLVNRETKEHKAASEQAVWAMENHPDFNAGWKIVEADDEGWIPWNGNSSECPLPDNAMCDLEWRKESYSIDLNKKAGAGWAWEKSIVGCNFVKAYRPILAEKEEDSKHFKAYGSTLKASDAYIGNAEVTTVFDRLRNATEAAESIPAILAEINAMLPDGYCVTKREEPAEDMSDWRNWKEGDLVAVIREENGHGFPIGSIVRIKQTETGGHDSKEFLCELDSSEWYLLENEMCFYSRPKK